MTTARQMQISAVLAMHNEERLVRPCLESLAAIADEVLVVHDGPCRDRSVEIAREFTPHVFVHEYRGAPETNLIRLIRKASHDWILKLDCDETFSPALTRALLDIKREQAGDTVTHFKAIWRAVYSGADECGARPGDEARRPVLFRRSCTRWIGIPHSAPFHEGIGEAIYECVYHYAPHQQFGFFDLLSKKMLPFSKVDAAIRVKYPIDVMGFEGKRIENILRPIDRWRSERPLLVAGPLAALAFARSFMGAFRFDSTEEFLRNMRWPLAHGAYQLLLAYHIHRLRKQGYSSGIAPTVSE